MGRINSSNSHALNRRQMVMRSQEAERHNGAEGNKLQIPELYASTYTEEEGEEFMSKQQAGYSGNAGEGGEQQQEKGAAAQQQTGQRQGELVEEAQESPLKNIPLESKKDIKIVTTILPHLGAALKDIFRFGSSYPATAQGYENSTADTARARELESIASDRTNYTNVPEKLKFGFKNMVSNFLSETKKDTGEVSRKLPDNSSVTVLVDFTSDTPDINSYSVQDQADVAPEFSTKKAYRFTCYSTAGATPSARVEVEGLNPVVKDQDLSKDDAQKWTDMNFSFVEDPSERNGIGVKKFTDNEKSQVMQAVSTVPDSVLQTIKGVKFERARISKTDLDNQAKTQKGKPKPAAEVGAEYSSKNKTITVYDFGLENGVPGIFEAGEAGFSTGLRETITQAAGEEKFTNNAINFNFNEKPKGRPEEPHIGLKTFSDNEKRQVYGAIAKLPDDVLKNVSGITFERAEISEDDYKKQEDVKKENLHLPPGQKKKDIPPPTVSADYSYKTHTLTVYTHAFEKSLTIFGDENTGFSTGLEQTILHEVGHAFDKKELRAAFDPLNPINIAPDISYKIYSSDYDKKEAEVGKNGTYTKATNGAIKNYNDKLADRKKLFAQMIIDYNGVETSPGVYQFNPKSEDKEKYTSDLAKLNKLDDELAALDRMYQEKQTELDQKTAEWADKLKIEEVDFKQKEKERDENKANARSESGSRNIQTDAGWDKDKENEKISKGSDAERQQNAGDNKFRQAAILDRGDAITKYGMQDWTEYYAEAFSLYFTDRERMKIIEPNVFNYFEAKFGKKQ